MMARFVAIQKEMVAGLALFVMGLMILPVLPAVATDFVISSDMTAPPGAYGTNTDTLTVKAGATLYLQGFTHLTAAEITVEEGAAISADGSGYGPNSGPGAGWCCWAAGSYGGFGANTGNNPALLYGSVLAPLDLGSGGRDGAGGGAVFLEVGGDVVVDGTISANGQEACVTGSGGSVYIVTNTISGSGTIAANGGIADCGGYGGGGGRVAVHCSIANTFAGQATASGASGGTSGTVILIDDSDAAHLKLQTNQPWWHFDFSNNISELTLVNARLTADWGANTQTLPPKFSMVNSSLDTRSLSGRVELNGVDVAIDGGSSILGNVSITAANLALAAGAVISADGAGYGPDSGPGAGWCCWACGSYGGPGANTGWNPALLYGSLTAPVDFGSGGGYGSGGGAVFINVGNLALDGAISANGQEACVTGSGGSVYVIATTLSGSGAMSANGGIADCGGYGGGGGRVAVHYTGDTGISTFTGQATASGGSGGGTGTVIFIDDSDLTRTVIDGQNGFSLSLKDLDFSSTLLLKNVHFTPDSFVDHLTTTGDLVLDGNTVLDVRAHGGALFLLKANSITLPSGSSLLGNLDIQANNVSVAQGAVISADGAGNGPGSGPGAGGANQGGSYGGYGMGVTAPGKLYGSTIAPTDLGSGGGAASGGGALKLEVANTLLVDGGLSSNGLAASGGAGSGGSVYILAGVFSGSGSVLASGGAGVYGGGGGRVAVYYTTNTFAGPVTAAGANPGTVVFLDNSDPTKIVVDGQYSTLPGLDMDFSETLVLRNVHFTGAPTYGHLTVNGDLVLEGATVFDVRAHAGMFTLKANNITIPSGSSLLGNLDIQATTVNVAPGGVVSADGIGYGPGAGPGAGGDNQGGSYGGLGDGQSDVSKRYGSAVVPVDFGSGGGPDGAGGGALKIEASALTVDGTVSANAGDSAGNSSGSGGSVYIITCELSGAGVISANGGDTVEGGGGGRVAVYFTDNEFDGLAVALGGGNGQPGTAGFIDETDPANLKLQTTNAWRFEQVDAATTFDEVAMLDTQATVAGNMDTLAIPTTLTMQNSTFDVRNLPGRFLLLTGSVALDETSSITGNITILGELLYIAEGAIISADGLGYGADAGPGARDSAGGSYGGLGMGTSDVSALYGNSAAPVDFGSGGSSSAGIGLPGGGAIKLVASSWLVLDGTLSANGGSGPSGAAGSGGSILVVADYMMGGSTGALHANGGSAALGGGGGRVAIHSKASTFLGHGTAAAGNGAQAGSVAIFKDNTDPTCLVIDGRNGGALTTADTDVNRDLVLRAVQFTAGAGFDHLTVSGDLVLEGGTVLDFRGHVGQFAIQAKKITVLDGCKLLGNLSIQAQSIEIEPLGVISADGAGYGPDSGPGAGWCCWAAGSYGGLGVNTGDRPDLLYGSAFAPVDLGSGGGYGAGGGALYLNVTGNIFVDGTISANGQEAYATGSGGSVYIIVNTISGAGTVTANGGIGSYGGGGGRVAVHYRSGSPLAVQTTALGGSGGNPGTVAYIDESDPANLKLYTGHAWRFEAVDLGVTYSEVTMDDSQVSVGWTVNTATISSKLTMTDSTFNVRNQANSFLAAIPNITLEGNSTLTGTMMDIQATNLTVEPGSTISGNITIDATDLTVDAGGVISADGSGYGPQSGPGFANWYSGASYGGRGGRDSAPTYGSSLTPTDPGSGGNEQAGGGIIRLDVAGTLTLDGTVSSNGASGACTGGSSGGSIYITTDTLAGAGNLAASGGSSNCGYGGGGGGRIAVYYTSSSFSGAATATGGSGNGGEYGTVAFLPPNGGGGYIYSFGPSWHFGPTEAAELKGQTVVLNNCQATGDSGVNLEMNSLTLNQSTLAVGGAGTPTAILVPNLTIGSGSTLSGNMDIQTTNLTIESGGTITGNVSIEVPQLELVSGATISGNVTLTTDDLTIDAGGVIAADGFGYGPGQGPGASGNYWAGASYGGSGGNGGVPTYGSALMPTDPGSGGYQQAGGGVVLLNVSGTLILDGTVSSNGASGECYGGSSGGSIYITTDALAGAGNFAADGESSYCGYGGGGGGRIAVYYTTSSFAGTSTATGGGGYGGGEYGSVILSDQSDPTHLKIQTSMAWWDIDFIDRVSDLTLVNAPLTVDPGMNTATLPAKFTMVNSSLDVRNSSGRFELTGVDITLDATSSITGNITITADSLTLASGGVISANGSGNGAYAGPGAATDWTQGGSYGGLGYNVGDPARLYGSAFAPVDLGSGGGGAAGGGAIKLDIGTLDLDGTVSANGGDNWCAGGDGSGGSVYVLSDSLAGTGAIRANGGVENCRGWGGGGGRVAIYFTVGNTFAGQVTATGGNNAGQGTVVFLNESMPRYTVTASSLGHGTVSVAPPPDADGKYLMDTVVTLAATPIMGYHFVQWSDGPLGSVSTQNPWDMSVTADINVTASFAIDAVTVATVIYSDTTWDPGEYGSNTDTLTIKSGATLHVQGFTHITVAQLTVEPGAAISADGQGNIAGAGPGAGGSGEGGSYGGLGGGVTDYGRIYGSPFVPVDLGSGGDGGAGGGAIRLDVGSFTLDGGISANGANGNGAGSGGSVYIIANNLAGSGWIQANGGYGYNGNGGGGGRVAVDYTATAFDTNRAWASAGNNAGAGTVAFIDESNPTNPALVAGTTWRLEETGTGFSSVTLSGTTATVEPGTESLTVTNLLIVNSSINLANASGYFTLSGDFTLDSSSIVGNNLTITNDNLVLAGSSSITASTLSITTGTLSVDGGSRISVDGGGYGPGAGPGAGGPGEGGSYGGLGAGVTDYGRIYGSPFAPLDFGSGGGGGAGGGAVKLDVQSFTLNGTVSANGSGICWNGAGSGGSVYIIANALTGSGSIQANGGSDGCSGNGGGGGRVAAHYTTSAFGTSRATASGWNNAGAGTVAFIDESNSTNPALVAGTTWRLEETGTGFSSVTLSGTTATVESGTDSFNLSNLPNLQILNGSTINLSNASGNFALTGDFTLENSGIVGNNLTITNDNLVLAESSSITASTLSITTGTLSVDGGSRISADGYGYGPGAGPGAGAANEGGSYGGLGAGVTDYGRIYGSPFAPVDLGSGGGGGAGGGAIKLDVQSFTLDGTVSANGASICWNGAGSGGSVYVIANALTGSGSIQANGGSDGCSGNGGGGGRVAVHYTTSAFNTSRSTAYGWNNAGAGTVAFIDESNSTNPALVAGTTWRLEETGTGFSSVTLSGTTATVESGTDSFNLSNLPNLQILNGSTINLSNASGNFALTGDFTLENSGIVGNNLTITNDNLVLAESSSITASTLSITTGTLSVDGGSRISADGYGYGPGAGPGAGAANEGGSYGGLGAGVTDYGRIYGSPFAPVDLGSGGGGGAGGGAIKLDVQSFTLDGTVSANGASICWNGAGSGGSVYVIANALTGSGSIQANGGSDGCSGNGGGGGRVAVHYTTSAFNTSRSTAYGWNNAGAGTVAFIDESNPTNPALVAGTTWRLEETGTGFSSVTLSGTTATVEPGTDSFNLSNLPNLQILNGSTINLSNASGNFALTGDFTLQNSAIVGNNLAITNDNSVLAGSSSITASTLSITTGTLSVDGGSRISVDGGGYGPGAGPGAGGPGEGGSYGGLGAGVTDLGRTYGSPFAPVDLGSGGGGGAGGGAVMLNVGSFTLDGAVSANGADIYCNGAGSGGSVYIIVNALTGSGSIQANGGNDWWCGNGGGGGGRVAVDYMTSEFDTSRATASGGNDAGAGTAGFVNESMHRYTVTASSLGNGTVSLAPPPDVDGKYLMDTIVSLMATPDANYRVEQWTGTDDDSLTTNTNTVTVTGDRSVTVAFVYGVFPLASFTAMPTSGPAPLNVQFTDTSNPGTSPITAWAWDLDGDGNIDSTDQNPTFKYLAQGTYTPSLTVTTEVGSSTTTGAIIVTASTPPTASFYASPNYGVEPLLVNFYDNSSPGTSPITKWHWDFGDPYSPEQGDWIQSPVNGHYYRLTASIPWPEAEAQAEAWGGRLATVRNADENEWIRSTFASPQGSVWIGFTDHGQVGNWVWIDGEPVTYTDWNSGEPNNDGGNETCAEMYSSGAWNDLFEGDGLSGVVERDLAGEGESEGESQAQVSHTYTQPGTYAATLTVTTEVGLSTTTNTVTVVPPAGPTASFYASPTYGAAPLQVQFYDDSSPGTSSITSWAWDFNNDGIIDSTEQNPVFTYANTGTFSPSLTVTTDVDSNTYTANNYITVIPPSGPTANFYASPTYGAAPLQVQFYDYSSPGTSSISAWAWDFNNDGIIDSTEQNPVFTYANTGTFSPSLTVTTDVGRNTYTANNYITVTPPPKPIGGLSVTIYPTAAVSAGAQWSIDGGVTWNNSGTSLSDLPDGNLTVSFSALAGWTTPASQSASITTGGTAIVTAMYVPQDVTVAYYRFEEGTGTDIIDSLYGSIDGTHNAAYSTSVPVSPIPLTGATNTYSLSFDGAASAMITGQPFIFHKGFGDATLEFWINLPDQPHHSIFWTREDDTDTNRFNIWTDPGGMIGFDYRTPGGDFHLIGEITVPINIWSHVAVVRSVAQATQHTYSFYVNGSLVYTGTDPNPDLPTSTTWTISGRSGYEMTGLIDEIRFSNAALDPADFLAPPGTYVTLTYTAGANGSISGTSPQTVNSGASGIAVTALPDAGYYFVQWSDGSTQNPRTDINVTGNISVTASFALISVPSASFNASPDSGVAPLLVQFSDNSLPGTSIITVWAWDFDGDGNVDSAEQNPTFTYVAPGTYSASLTVTTAVGSSTATKTIIVTAPILPTAAFSARPNYGGAPLTVQFTNRSLPGSQPITSFAWDFDGDGTIDSTDANPTYTYPQARTYTASLTVASVAGSTTATQTITVVPPNTPPTAAFTASQTNGAVPLAVSFADQSTPGSSPITGWAWDSAGGIPASSTDQNPTVTYTAAGSYSVTLTVTSADGTGTITKSNYIVCAEAPVIAPISAATAAVGAPYTGPVPTLVAGSLPVTWTLAQGPSGMTIDSGTGVVSWPKAIAAIAPYQITIRATNTVGSGSASWSLSAPVPYTATVGTTVTSAPSGTPIPLTGSAAYVVGGNPAANVPVAIQIRVRGISRIITVTTDVNGAFSTIFQPLTTEGGNYEAAANYPDTIDDSKVDTTFSLYGIYVKPQLQTLSLVAAVPMTQDVDLSNLGETKLTGITATVSGLPAGMSLQVDPPTELDGLDDKTVAYTVLAAGVIPQSTVLVTFSSAEGASTTMTLMVSTQAAQLWVDPGQLNSGMMVGAQTLVQFDLVNNGGTDTNEIAIALPPAPWMTLATPMPVPPIAPGQRAPVTLVLTPPVDLALGPYTGTILVYDTTQQITVPFEFKAMNEAVGGLDVSVVDEFTYFDAADGYPKLAGAAVRVTDPTDQSIVAQGVTDATGEIVLTGIHEALYQVDVTADKHTPFRQLVKIKGGQTTMLNAFLSREVVTYNFNVYPTTIPDVYNFTLDVVFETNVPVPVVIVDPPLVDLTAMNGPEMQVDFTITNQGLIAAQNVQLNIGTHPRYQLVPLTQFAGDLAAKASVVVPVKIIDTMYGASEGVVACCGAEKNAKRGNEKDLVTATACQPIILNFGYEYDCDGPRTKAVPVEFKLPDVCRGGSGWSGPIYAGGGGGSSSGGGGGPVFTGPSFTYEPVGEKCKDCVTSMLTQAAKCLLGFVPLGNVGGAIMAGANLGFDCFGGNLQVADCAGSILGAAAAVASVSPGVGTALNAISCAQNLITTYITTCTQKALTGVSAEADAAFAVLQQRTDRLNALMAFYSLLIGNDTWFSTSSTDGSVYQAWFGQFNAFAQPGSDEGQLISAAEQTQLENMPYPSQLTLADVDAFIARWNRTIQYWQAGILTVADVPTGASTDFIPIDELQQASDAAQAASLAMIADGFDDPVAAVKDAEEKLMAALNAPDFGSYGSIPMGGGTVAKADTNAGVCAKVTVQLQQKAVLTRNAFEADLDITNNGDTMSDISATLEFTDLAGNTADQKFFVGQPDVTGMTGVDGAGTLDPTLTGTAKWLIIPGRDAAPAASTQYFVSGALSYTQDGVSFQVPLYPDDITVMPDPSLDFTYFIQRDVYSDDPFTPEVEPAEPFSLGLLVSNHGQGTAWQLSVDSGQPTIVDNQKGLLVNFTILGSQVGVLPEAPTLKVDLGDVKPAQTVAARWIMTSTLSGQFVNYQATYTHTDDLGGQQTSLVDQTSIHSLIHVMRVDQPADDGVFDFLVNDNLLDLNKMPDTIYSSAGGTLPVSVATSVATDGLAGPGHMQVQLTAATVTGWTYIETPDPGQNLYQLQRVVRSDGREIRMDDNAWTTHRMIHSVENGDYRQDLAHLVDFNSTGSYTLYYVTSTSQTYTLELSVVSGNGTVAATEAPPYTSGEVVHLTAAPDPGYRVKAWTGTDNDVSTDNTNTVTMTADKIVTVEFELNPFTLTYAADANGSITGASPQTVNYGASGATVTAAPNTGYHFVQWSDASAQNPRADLNVTANISVTASFAINTYSLTYIASANGSITGTSPQTVNYGASGATVTAAPNTGYHFVQWSDASTQNPRTDANIMADISVTASFAIDAYTLAYTAGVNGTISGISAQTVDFNTSGTAVTAVPNAGNHFVQWSDASIQNPRTDMNVTANISVTAAFASNSTAARTITGVSVSIDATPDTSQGATGYLVQDVLPTGLTATNISSSGYWDSKDKIVKWLFLTDNEPRTLTYDVSGPVGSYTYTSSSSLMSVNGVDVAITGDTALTVLPVLTYTAGAGGSITGASPQTVDYGTDGAAVTAAPDTGYHFVQWSDSSTQNPRTDTNVTVNVNVTASFAIDTFTLTYAAAANGSITGASPQTVNYGTDGAAVTAAPDTGYHFVQWSDGSTQNPRTDTNVTVNVNVTASFAIDTFTLTYAAAANGSITGASPQTVDYGTDGVAVTAAPNAHYHFVNWSDTSTQNPRADLNVTANISVTANFSIDTFTLTLTLPATGTLTAVEQPPYAFGTVVHLTATPLAGSVVQAWTGADTEPSSQTTNTVTMTTDKTVSVQFVRLFPCDTNPLPNNKIWDIEANELSAYIGAWLNGSDWPIAPTSIPPNYVSRAVAIWLNGEKYTNVGGSEPLCWVVVTGKALHAKLDAKDASTAARTITGASVSIAATPDDNELDGYVVQDALPDGLTAANISGNGRWDSKNNIVKWVFLSDNEPRTLTYTVVGAGGSYMYSGNSTVSVNGIDTPITGDTALAIPLAHTLTYTADAGGSLASDGAASAAILSVSPDTGTPGDGITNARTVTLSGVASGPGGFTVEVYEGETDLGAATGTAAWAYAPPELSYGSHAFTAKVVAGGSALAASAEFPIQVLALVADAGGRANNGAPWNAKQGARFMLDGSRAHDPDGGAPIGYIWVFDSKPVTSLLTDNDIINARMPTAAFVPDVVGLYTPKLTVTDSEDAAYDQDATVVIQVTAANDVNAVAGPDASAKVGESVTLDGRKSTPPTAKFAWITSGGPGKVALSAPDAGVTDFSADTAGDYTATLAVTSNGFFASDSLLVHVVAGEAPKANAGIDQLAMVDLISDVVNLDGTLSTPAAGGAGVSYSWQFVSFPGATAPELTGATGVAPAFVPTAAGSYVLRLTLTAGNLSNSDNVVVTVQAKETSKTRRR